MTLPVTLLIDDSSPIHLGFWHNREHKSQKHRVVPNSFLSAFADLSDAYGVRGKFSVVPMPCNLGRIDRAIHHLDAEQLQGFIHIVRERIMPGYDISPELLTHLKAVDLSVSGEPVLDFQEDEWIKQATTQQMIQYIERSLEILKKAGLEATGVTSPWATGQYNEPDYARAIGTALWSVSRIKLGWYLLHCLTEGKARWPWVTHKADDGSCTVVTIPAGTDDYYWPGIMATSRRTAEAKYTEATDRYLTADGRGGRLRELYNQRVPLTILTHWQCLFDDGHGTGLVELEKLLQRIAHVFGDDVTWTNCRDLAKLALRRMPEIPQKTNLQAVKP